MKDENSLSISIKDVPELRKAKSVQEQLIKDYPFIRITDTKTLAAAKRAKSALMTGRTDIQKGEKFIVGQVNDFKKNVKYTAIELILITQDAEEKQKEEIKRYEDIKAAEKAEKERIKAEELAAFSNKAAEILDINAKLDQITEPAHVEGLVAHLRDKEFTEQEYGAFHLVAGENAAKVMAFSNTIFQNLLTVRQNIIIECNELFGEDLDHGLKSIAEIKAIIKKETDRQLDELKKLKAEQKRQRLLDAQEEAKKVAPAPVKQVDAIKGEGFVLVSKKETDGINSIPDVKEEELGIKSQIILDADSIEKHVLKRKVNYDSVLRVNSFLANIELAKNSLKTIIFNEEIINPSYIKSIVAMKHIDKILAIYEK